ncbi:hypothetical protein, variant [Aphanomyces invadans]|uniref:ACB domain-containing protein n=1 Tax=Aphanomyces invadans TaxID=157072 RepID=A0A024TZC1_9STRA|nr:hypothetical protein, variant [Aphanomyces invadans]ETV99348.1 hypothetical protein, variant [Aphanomyces invadans]|eukprot:XP_008871904.1 hypothetical protein, variant [Aphanomyces invadans]
MWVARGLPRVIKRESDASVVAFSTLGQWKVEVTPTSIQLQCMYHKDAPPFPPTRLARETESTPLASAFLPSNDTSRIVVLTPTTLEMYSYVLDLTDGVRLHAHESITFGKDGVEEGTCLAVNEDHIFIGTSIARTMIFRWAVMGNGGHVIAPLDSFNQLHATTATGTLQCTSIACNSSFHLTSRVVLAASFSDGTCAVLTFKPPTASSAFHLDHLEVVRQVSNSTIVALDADAGLLAVGTTTSVVHLFRLHHPKRRSDASWSSRSSAILRMDDTPLVPPDDDSVNLSLGLWGYSSDDVGPVSSLAFTDDGRAIAIGYARRGLSVFSTDGCKLMSTLHQVGVGPSKTEVAPYGVQRVSWSHAALTLAILPNGQPAELSTIYDREVPNITLFSVVDVELSKDEDGLCLSLAGEPNQPGAWVRSEEPFVPRTSDGRPGPAELSRKLQGGELLLSIDGSPMWQSPFEEIVHRLKEVPVGSTVAITFLVVCDEEAFSLAVDALSSETFRTSHHVEWTTDHSIWEYSLRMQALHGDCNTGTAPTSLLDFEANARFNGWAALRDCSKRVALHRYVKLYLSLFPTVSPLEALELLEPDSITSSPTRASTPQMPLFPSVVLLDFARSVLPLDRSDLHLLESQGVVMVSSRSCNDPCGVLSSVTAPVPTTYAQANFPMQHLAVNSTNTRLAVAGTRGFALLNKRTNKWLMFGSELEEQSFGVVAITWWKDDMVVALVRESNQALFLDAFPRNRLDMESRKAHIAVLNDVHALTVDDDAVYCLSDSKLWVYRIAASATVESSAFAFSLRLCRTEPLPLCNAVVGRTRCFSVVPRLQRRIGHESESNSWFGGMMWSLFSEPTSQWTIPRFLILDQVNNAYLWDPETKIQTLLATGISQISHWSPRGWPLLCSHVVGLYGRHGYQVWWPFLEGIAFAPPVNDDVAIQFLQANDPFRSKQVAPNLSNTLTWESYVRLLAEYGVHLQSGDAGFGCSMPMLLDPLLRFNPEVQILGVHPDFGVLVGALQENYMGVFDVSCRVQPFVHTTICYLLVHHQTEMAAAIRHAISRRCALTTLTQELVLVTILDNVYQTKWNVAVLEKALALLKDTDHDMETYCEIVANVARKVEPNRLSLLFPLAGDPTQLLQLCRQRNEVRTAANFLLCLDESGTANEPSTFRPRTNSYAQFQSRSAVAFELLVDCCEKDQLALAMQVVRVARAWEPDHYRSNNQQYDRYIDEQVGKYAFQMLVQHRFDKVVWLLTQVEAALPTLHGEELGIHDKNVQLIQARLLALLTPAQLRAKLSWVVENYMPVSLQRATSNGRV